MNLTKDQRSLIERIINTAETGRPEGNYATISLYADGPHDIKQITYGRAQTTEYGNLRKLVQMYVAANGTYSNALAPYAEKVGSVPLTDNAEFKTLLRNAGKNDPIMKEIQDQFFEMTYFNPAMKWADENGFTKALSALVIYDSYIHDIKGTVPFSALFLQIMHASRLRIYIKRGRLNNGSVSLLAMHW